MMLILPILALLGCTPADGERCPTGVRESFSSTVQTPDGPLTVETSMCIASRWERAPCESDRNPEACEYVFEPNTPPKAPLQLIFGDFVGTWGIGHVQTSPPAVLDGGTGLQSGLQAHADSLDPTGYDTSFVQPMGATAADYPSFALTVSCDHPDADPICPFTWDYLLVDLTELSPGLYADFGAVYAADVEAGNNSAILPEEFEDWDIMVETATIELK